MGRPLELVLGGTRSGKSTHALARIRELAGTAPVAYLATVLTPTISDPELDDRIRRHRLARPASWPTIDVGLDLPAAVAAAGAEQPILLDGLTLWLSALADVTFAPQTANAANPAARSRDPHTRIDALLDGPVRDGLEALVDHGGPVVVVSDEIGLGMVPMDAHARAFRDLQGIVHQRLAALAHEVVLVVAGLPMTLKATRHG